MAISAVSATRNTDYKMYERMTSMITQSNHTNQYKPLYNNMEKVVDLYHKNTPTNHPETLTKVQNGGILNNRQLQASRNNLAANAIAGGHIVENRNKIVANNQRFIQEGSRDTAQKYLHTHAIDVFV